MCFPDIFSCPHFGYREMPEEGQIILLACAGNIVIKHLFQLPDDLDCLHAGGNQLLSTASLKPFQKHIVGVHPLLTGLSDDGEPESFSSERSCRLYATPLSILGRR